MASPPLSVGTIIGHATINGRRVPIEASPTLVDVVEIGIRKEITLSISLPLFGTNKVNAAYQTAFANKASIALIDIDIDAIQADILTNAAAIAALDFDLSAQSTNYTTTDREIVVCTAAITVSLNASAADKERVIVIRDTTAGTVTVDGNGKNINDASTYALIIDTESIELIYVASQVKWYII